MDDFPETVLFVLERPSDIMWTICMRNSSPRLTTNSLSLSTSYISCSTPEIVIPPRKERGPTDILEVLASTVGKDYTAPDYKYHDDPWLIPYKNNNKRDFTLSKESGRKAARYIMNQHPDLFEQNRIEAEPPITAFQPRAKYNRDNVTVELLDNLVNSFQVQDSIDVFTLLKIKGKDIPTDLKQGLLELVAFHNESEPEEEGRESRGILKEQKHWKAEGFVEQEYSSGGEATEGERVTMLVGLGRHGGGQKVWQMYEECKANKDRIPVEGYNVVISRVEKKEGVEKGMEAIKGVLTDMKEAKVTPTVCTLIAVLEVLGVISRSKENVECRKYALDFLAEFKLLGVEMSLGVYKSLMDIYFDPKKPKSPILGDIMNVLEGQDMSECKHYQDLWFMPQAMKFCSQMNNVQLAWRVEEFFHTGNNARLLSDFQMEQVYYSNFLTVVLQNDEFETAIDLYNKLVPHTFSPMSNYYQSLLNHIHSNGALQYLGKVWDDIEISDYAQSSKSVQYELTHQVMQILKSNDPASFDFTGLSEVYSDISRKVFDHLEANKAEKALYLRFNNLAPGICDLVVAVSLREGNYPLAARVMEFCRQEKAVMAKNLSNDVLSDFIEASVVLGEIARAIDAVEYSVDVASSEALKFGLVISKTDLKHDQRDYLNKLFANNTSWVNI